MQPDTNTRISVSNEREVKELECAAQGPPLAAALYRTMRAVLFSEAPVPELDALPMAQMRLLWAVHHSPAATMKDLSDRLRVSQSTVTQLADRLVRRGLVYRRGDDTDRRVVRLAATQTGSEILNRATTQQARTLEAVWEELAPDQRGEIVACLEALSAAAEAVRAEQGVALPPWRAGNPDGEPSVGISDDLVQAQPVVDLLSRRIRGAIKG
ncbi:MAG TPA: MarR family transcriptional regulator [Chthonomonadales bacterium]|nr:MarR family transcriptional regulator [Chthonomonadales bacterium]